MIQADPVGLGVAFGAGMASFLSPCVLPLVPGYISMVSGLTVGSSVAVRTGGAGPGVVVSSSHSPVGASPALGYRHVGFIQRAGVAGATGGFVFGFTVVFVALGAAASSVGTFLRHNQPTLTLVAGWTTIGVGVLVATGYVPRILAAEHRFHVRPSALGVWAPPIMGMAFAFGWTPCIGPVLGAVLALAATRASVVSGSVLLVAYSLGLGVPFLAAGIAWGRAVGVLSWLRKRTKAVGIVSGLMLVAWGVLLAMGELHVVSSWVSNFLVDVGLKRLSVS